MIGKNDNAARPPVWSTLCVFAFVFGGASLCRGADHSQVVTAPANGQFVIFSVRLRRRGKHIELRTTWP